MLSSDGMDDWGVRDLGENEDNVDWEPESMRDGMLEIAQVSGSLHLAQIQLGVATGHRLAQGTEIRIGLSSFGNSRRPLIPMQADGEPWEESQATAISIKAFGKASFLEHSSSNYYSSVANEVLEWGVRENVISLSQKQLLQAQCTSVLEQRKKNSINDEEEIFSPLRAHPSFIGE